MTVYALVSYFVPQMLSLQSGSEGWTKSETETLMT